MIATTIALPSRIDRALALAESSLRLNPAIPFVIVLIDEDESTLRSPVGSEFITLSELGVEYEPILKVQLDGPALQHALIPAVLARLFARDERVLILEDSMLVCGDLGVFDRGLDDAAMLVVPEPLARSVASTGLAVTVERGTVVTGAMALRNCASTAAVLAEWPTSGLAPVERLATSRDAYQAWCDALPQLPAVSALPRGIVQNDEGLGNDGDTSRSVLLDLRHFDPERPHLLSTRTGRARLSNWPELARQVGRYATQLLEAADPVGTDPWTEFADGTRLTPLLRQLASEAIEAGAVDSNIFTEEATEVFFDWLSAPATMGAAAGLNRYHEAIWDERIELRAAYPHLDGPDGFEYAGWLNEIRPAAVPLPDCLAPPAPATYEVPVEPITSKPPWGVNVTGLLSGKVGLGESARLAVDALTHVDVPTKPVQGRLRVPGGELNEIEVFDAADAPFAINLVCLNGDTIPHLARDIGNDFFKRRYTAALWWWELTTLPTSWSASFELIDEVWVGSDFIYDVVAPVSPVPVYKIKMPVRVPPFERRTRVDLGFPEDFVFLFVHDYHSTASRKNPVGLIRAFRDAFPENSGASLVLKSINADRLPLAHEAAKVAAAGRDDIHFIDGFVDTQTKNAMIDSCDCYVSLHRSEGFGLTLAEAMWLGKPTIATRYGGNLDFMTAENSFLVDHGMRTVGEDAFPYPPSSEWAEPDQAHAAELMRTVFEKPEVAAERGARAAADIRRTHGARAAGQTMARRLEEIYRWIEDDPAHSLNPERHVARLQRPGPASGAARLAPKQLAKLMLWRLEQLTLKRQRALDMSVAGAQRQLAASEAERAAKIAAMSDEIAELRNEIADLKRDGAPTTEGRPESYQR